MAHTIDNVGIDLKDSNAILKHVLNTIKLRCKNEASRKVVPFVDKEARISYYTGIPNSLFRKLLANETMTSRLDLDSRILILDTVKSIYTQNQTPNYTNIFDEVNKNGSLVTTDDKSITNLNQFVEEMEILGYQWKDTTKKTKIVMKDPEIRFERYIYLNKLRKFRNNDTQWQIVYVDERLVNDAQRFQKPWLTKPPQQESTGLTESTFYHAVSKTDFITGMFSNQASENDFAKWLTEILLMHLKSPSVIVMDNNPLHGSLENVSLITRYHSKTDMLRWLTNNNVPCSSSMSKPSLYELIRKCNEYNKEYKLDSVIRSQGHEVLRLPRHLYDLSMTTPLWDSIVEKGGVGDTNTLIHLQTKLMKLISSISPSNWLEYEQTLERKEKEILNIDLAMEKFSDTYEIKLGTEVNSDE